MKIWVLCCLSVGFDILDLLDDRLEVAGLIGLADDAPARGTISGYASAGDFAARAGLPVMTLRSYGLNDAVERQQIEALEIDILLVLGWQRLVPSWLIDHCRVAVLGLHGSSAGITAGRGRSPQNWALLFGDPQFSLSLFRIDAGIDSGPVVGTRTFPLTDRDDISTSYQKVALASAAMLAEALAGGDLSLGAGIAQDDAPARYLPKRIAEDGAIDWHRSCRDIDRFVRALTRPYPGAFSPLRGGKAIVWRARPLGMDLPGGSAVPGIIGAVFANNAFTVRTGDGWLLVDESSWEVPYPLRPGLILSSADFSTQMAEIVRRHRTACPELPLAAVFETFEAAEAGR